MNQVPHAVREIARLVLTRESNRSEVAEDEAHVALCVLDALRSHLSKRVGIAGSQALLARALALATMDAGWLEAVRVQADATLEGFSEAARTQSAQAVAEGNTALLAQLLELLVTFIGETLTLRLVQELWPEARDNARNSGPYTS